MTKLLILVVASLVALAAYVTWRTQIIASWKRLLAVTVCRWQGHRRQLVQQIEGTYRSECKVCERPIMKAERGDPWVVYDKKALRR